MRVALCLLAFAFAAACAKSAPGDAIQAQAAEKKDAEKKDAPADSSTAYVTRERKRYDLTVPKATWDDKESTLTITASIKEDPDMGKPPRAKVVLKLKDKAAGLKTDNLDKVTIAFEDFPNRGNESQSGANTKKAITALSGSTKTGEQATMEVNWTDTCEFKGKVVATVE